MYSQSAILTAATDIVGYQTSDDTNFAGLPSYLKTSNSGFYVNDLAGISLELINDARKERTFNAYVQQVHTSETLNLIQRFVARQKKKLETKELLSNVTIPQVFNDLHDTITKDSRFVGYAITPRESKSININIKEIGLQSSASESFTLYLFDPTQQTAIASDTVTCSGKSVEWTTLDWDVEFDKSDGGAGSTYLIGYFEDDLSGTLYEQDWADGAAHAAMKITRHYAGLSPFRFNNSTLSGVELPDMQYVESSLSCKTSGFVLRFNVKCDITDVLVDNITMFGEAIQHAIAIRYLRDALYDIRLQPTTTSAKNRESFAQLLTDYEGALYGGYIEDIGYRRGMLDNLALDFSELDAACLKGRADKITKVKW